MLYQDFFMLYQDFLMFNNVLMRFFGVKQYLNEIFCFNDTLMRFEQNKTKGAMNEKRLEQNGIGKILSLTKQRNLVWMV